MALIDSMRRQTCVYWALAAESRDAYGDPVYIAAVELTVRWEDVLIEFVDINGTTLMSNAIVYTGVDVVPGGVLMLGELTDVTDANVPKENTGAFEIMRFDKLPNLRNTKFLRTAYL